MQGLINVGSKDFSGNKPKKLTGFCRNFARSRFLLLLILPGFLYYLVFHYIPMYGVIIAFKDYNFFDGILGSPWAASNGLEHFLELFQSPAFYRVFRNTVLLSLFTIIFSFPAPIILALSLNEITNGKWRRIVQTVSYLPHFISTVVICGMIFNFLSLHGIVNQILSLFGREKILFLMEPGYFRAIYVLSDIWQRMGWGSIVYLAALAGVDPQLYEAAAVDGANRWHRILHINIPALVPTAIVLLILNMGGMMNVGFEKVLLLYQPSTYETADVIGTYIYRRGILGAEFSFSTAVGLFQSAIGFTLVVVTNRIARKFSDISLW